MTRRVLGMAVAVALLLGPTHAQAAAASSAALFFPGGCRQPDHGRLQSCIHSAHDGDRIRIRTNSIPKAIEISDKSLSLAAGVGYHPAIGGTITINARTGTRTVSCAA